MTKQLSVLHRRLIIVGPSLTIVAAYFLVVQLTLSRELKKQVSKLNNLTAIVSRSSLQSDSSQLAVLQEETQRLNEQLSMNQQHRSKLVSRDNFTRSTLSGSSAPASTIADLLELLERNELQCVKTLPLEPQDTKRPEIVPAATEDGGFKLNQSGNGELQITVQGTFQAMQAALDDLKTGSLGIQIVSLEMAECQAAVNRSWTLTVTLLGKCR